jgi:hypothetical protein
LILVNELLDAMLERVRTWPQERQAYAVEVLKLIEAQGAGPLQVSDDEWAAILEGNAQAERGEFVSDLNICSLDKSHRAD